MRPIDSWQAQPGPQTAFVESEVFEVVYGGARGGGKTDAALGDFALHAAAYGEFARGLLVRRSRVALEPTITRARQIYRPFEANWEEAKSRFVWPSGAVLYFRYLDRDADAELYQGHDYTGDTATNLVIANSALTTKSAGYLGAPGNGQNNDYTFALGDAGGCVTCSSVGGYTWTIPLVSAVVFPVCTLILVRNRAAGAITIAPASGVVLRKAGISGSASVSLSTWGLATLFMDESNEWVISGVGFS